MKVKTIRPAALLIAALLAALTGPAAATAADGIFEPDTALSRALARTWEVHPELRAAEADMQAAAEQTRQAGAWSDPMLGVNAANLPVGSFALDQEPMTALWVTISQAVPLTGRYGSEKRAAAARSEAAEQRRRLRIQAVGERASHAWFRWAWLNGAVVTLDSTLTLIDELIAVSRVRYETGGGMQQDLLRLQTERIRIQERRYEMAQRAVDAGRRFAAATGRDPGELPAPPGGLALRFPRLERSDLRDSLIAGSPLLAAMRGEVDARSAEARMKRQQWWPDLTINAGYGLRQDAPAGMARDDFLTVGLGLRLPLLSGGRQGHRVQRAELLERSAREELAADRLDLLQRLESLIDEDARHARQRELYTGGIVPLAEAALSSAIGAYSAGELDVDAVLNAQTTLLDARLTSLRHLAERAEVRASLAALLGRFGDQPAAAAKENTPDTGEQR